MLNSKTRKTFASPAAHTIITTNFNYNININNNNYYYNLPTILILLLLTTLIGLASSTVTIRPSRGRATLVPGQPLHFQCEIIDNKNADFLWFKRNIGEENEEVLEPNNDETIAIHNNRLTLLKPTISMAGDYICRGLREDKTQEPGEFAVIKVRTQPYIEDFGVDTSHTGKSSTVVDGDRVVLTCTVRDKTTPVNITWLKSSTPDDEANMIPIVETKSLPSNTPDDIFFNQMVSEPGIEIEILGEHSKKLVIDSIKPEHRSYYICLADNGVTERTRKIIFIRVKDRLIALWPFLGIVAELFILFTIIHIWETQRAYKEIRTVVPQATAVNKRPVSGPSGASEIAPLTSG